jgi:hypothetical protein
MQPHQIDGHAVEKKHAELPRRHDIDDGDEHDARKRFRDDPGTRLLADFVEHTHLCRHIKPEGNEIFAYFFGGTASGKSSVYAMRQEKERDAGAEAGRTVAASGPLLNLNLNLTLTPLRPDPATDRD